MTTTNQSNQHLCNKIACFLMLFFAIGFTSCKKDIVYKDENSANTAKASKTADLKVSNTFKWSTIHEMQVEINPNKAGLFMIQRSKAEVFHKAYL